MHLLFEDLLQQYAIKSEAIPPLQYRLNIFITNKIKKLLSRKKL